MAPRREDHRPQDDAARLSALEDFATRAAEPSTPRAHEATTRAVAAGLEAAGVPFVLLKGPALAALLYRPGEVRSYLDLDVLVAPGSRHAAGRVLAELGFRNTTSETGVDEFTGALHAETWQGSDPMPVDLHWRLAGCSAPPELAWPRLFATRQTIAVAGHQAPVLGRAGLALHLATHAAQHGAEDVKALADLERGLERWPRADWEAAGRLAAEVEATEAFAAGLRLSAAGAEMARALDLPATPELSWTIDNRRIRPRGTFHLEALGRAAGPRAAVRVLARSQVPNPVWIRREFPWARGGRLRLLAGYARHIVRTPRWAGAAWRYRRARARARRSPD
jgi:hypothetical protein